MQLTRQHLKSKIGDAWEAAIQIPFDPSKKQTKYEQRSASWVDCLAKGLQTVYPDQKGYRVFWHGRDDEQFDRTEFLFDIMVARIGQVESLEVKSNLLDYVEACEWTVESEVDMKNFRSIIIDMSKLVLAKSKKKLFVASHRPADVEKKILDRCFQMAENCSGEVYFCFIEHPERWGEQRNPPCLYKLKEGDGWTPL